MRWTPQDREVWDFLNKPDPSPPDVPDRPGWIYIARDPDRPQILKIGLTVVSVDERLKSLSANSSQPVALVELASFRSEAVDYHEWHIHKLLKPHHHGKEWYRCELSIAVAACRKIIKPEPEPEPEPDELATYRRIRAYQEAQVAEPPPPPVIRADVENAQKHVAFSVGDDTPPPLVGRQPNNWVT